MTIEIPTARRPLASDVAASLRALVATYAVDRVAKVLGTSRHSVLAGASGRELRADIANRIEEAIREQRSDTRNAGAGELGGAA